MASNLLITALPDQTYSIEGHHFASTSAVPASNVISEEQVPENIFHLIKSLQILIS